MNLGGQTNADATVGTRDKEVRLRIPNMSGEGWGLGDQMRKPCMLYMTPLPSRLLCIAVALIRQDCQRQTAGESSVPAER